MTIGPVLREAWHLWRRHKGLTWISLVASLPTALSFGLLGLHVPSSLVSAGIAGRLLVGVLVVIISGVTDVLLIAAVRRARAERTRPRLLQTLRARWKSALGVTVFGALTGLISEVAFSVPGWLGALGLELPAVIAVAAVLLLPYAALEITRVAWIEVAMRHAVLEELDALPALLRAWRFLHGRVRLAFELCVASALLALGSLIAFVAPMGAIFALRLTASAPVLILDVGLAALLLVGVPLLCVERVLRSSIWTLSFLDERAIR